MARECSLPPSASSLSESLRDLGYSLETAIDDLIDNSVVSDGSTMFGLWRREPTAQFHLLKS